MEIRQLKQFVTLAQTLNFRKAAELLHMAQPPLSAAIKRLEESWGVSLFIRTRRGTELTPAGMVALEEAQRAIFHAEQAIRAARASERGETGTLRLGFVGTAAYAVMPGAIPLFRQRYPGVKLQLVESTTTRITTLVETGELDAGLVRVPLGHTSTARILTVDSDILVAALCAKNPLASRRRLTLSDLRDEPFVMYSAQMVPGLYAATMLACQKSGFVPRIYQEAIQVPTVVSLVESGLGVALVPSVVMRYSNPQIVFKQLAGSNKHLDIGIALVLPSHGQTTLAANFEQCLAFLKNKK